MAAADGNPALQECVPAVVVPVAEAAAAATPAAAEAAAIEAPLPSVAGAEGTATAVAEPTTEVTPPAAAAAVATAAATSSPPPTTSGMPMYFVANHCATAKPGKSLEDAVFTGKHAVGLADGVGSWASKGVDAGAYARALMGNAKKQADMAVERAAAGGGRVEVDPYDVVRYAADNTKLPGSSTAVVATIGSAGTLRLYNVGDSVAMVWRREGGAASATWSLVLRTTLQRKGSNHPNTVKYRYSAGGFALEDNKGDAYSFTPQLGDLCTYMAVARRWSSTRLKQINRPLPPPPSYCRAAVLRRHYGQPV